MCSNQDNLSIAETRIPRTTRDVSKCKKCEGQAYLLLHKEHPYCSTCFHDHVTHKFRATIGKSKLVKKGNRILIAVSGGPSSMAMVQMTRDGLSLDNEHRRLQFIPSLIHVDESLILPPHVTHSSIDNITDWTMSQNLDTYFTSIAKSFRVSDSGFFVRDDVSALTVTDEEKGKLLKIMSAVTSGSGKEELVRRLRMQLLVDVAVAEGFDAIFLGTSGSRLAIQLITDVAQGKGNQIHEETGFIDDRFPIPILKPMREFVGKEVHLFLRMREIPVITTPDLLTKASVKDSLGKVTESFINSLESEFPSTTYSLCRIATKIRPKQSDASVCPLCHSINDRSDAPNCSALTALSVTRSLCNSNRGVESEFEKALCFTCYQIAMESEESSEGLQSVTRVRRGMHIGEDFAGFLIDGHEDEVTAEKVGGDDKEK